MHCPICKGTGYAPVDRPGYALSTRVCGTDASGTDDSGARVCTLCFGSGRLAAAVDAPSATPSDQADEPGANERFQAERQMLTLLLDCSVLFPADVTTRWRNDLQMIELDSPVFGAALLSDLLASFGSERAMLRARYDWMSAYEKRPFERECEEIERGLTVLYALLEEAAMRLQGYAEGQQDGDPAQ